MIVFKIHVNILSMYLKYYFQYIILKYSPSLLRTLQTLLTNDGQNHRPVVLTQIANHLRTFKC